MIVNIALLHFDGGKRVPFHRLHFLAFDILGDLVMQQAHVSELRRSSLVAKLWTLDGSGLVLPALLDAQVIYAKEERMVVRGIECDDVCGRFTAQAWWVKVQGAVLTGPHQVNAPGAAPTPAPGSAAPGQEELAALVLA